MPAPLRGVIPPQENVAGSKLRALMYVAACVVACGVDRAAAQDADALRTGGVSLLVVREPGTSECPDEAELRQQVEARVGRDVFAAGGDVHVIVRLSHRRGVHRATLTILEHEAVVGERSVEDRDCGEVIESIAVLLALIVAPAIPTVSEARAGTSPDAPALEATSVAVEPPASVAAQPPATESTEPDVAADETGSADERPERTAERVGVPVEPPADALRVSVTAAAGVILGWLPEATLVGRGALGLGQRSWSVRLEARAALDATASGLIVGEPATATVSWAGGAAVGCGHLDVLALCGHVVLARSAGRGGNVEAPRSDEALVLGLGASAGVGWQPWPWLRLEAEVELDVPVLVPEARIDGVAIWRATPVAGLGTLGASLVLE